MDNSNKVDTSSSTTKIARFESAAEALLFDIEPADMEKSVARLRQQPTDCIYLPICTIDSVA